MSRFIAWPSCAGTKIRLGLDTSPRSAPSPELRITIQTVARRQWYNERGNHLRALSSSSPWELVGISCALTWKYERPERLTVQRQDRRTRE
ncbi:hypothetical protein EXIGLDRAFT_145792 [Exidia glandulosa HHB12029]|uniref:Uncharacterized protein n=1 Tax=Exidia glandulosa HHB12029 TaxID=1314781 RepID=A0A165CW37_EXIGL|nr:hypothetical protein EXIGLDRAFT_322675 [Exidia glandulosa HHB12029]KZW00604.1 hypothetical protein EXIGLDRAFT_145792 [Exidia glandulosa HHB12029]